MDYFTIIIIETIKFKTLQYWDDEQDSLIKDSKENKEINKATERKKLTKTKIHC